MWLYERQCQRARPSIGSAWLQRARRSLDGAPPCVELATLVPLLRRLGVIAVDRSAASGVVAQVATMIRTAEGPMWFALAPEGTRKRVERWKPGFWKIASQAGVPVVPAYFHYPDKVIGIGPPFVPGEDMEADLAVLRAWYRPWEGRHHGTP